MPRGAFVFTSNVDGQFQKAGFPDDRVHECHGSIHALQCMDACTDDTWSAKDVHPRVNENTAELESPVPRCPHCDAVARPNILMFGDWEWVGAPYETQRERLAAWMSSLTKPLTVELGAGKGLPTVRRFSERYAAQRLIRINLREPDTIPSHGVALKGAAAAMLQLLDARL